MGGIISAISELVEAIVALFASILQLVFNIITWPFRFLAKIIRKLAEIIMHIAEAIGGGREPSGLAKLIGWIVILVLILLGVFACAIIFNVDIPRILDSLGISGMPSVP